MKQMLVFVCKTMIESEEYLCQMDSYIGDGGHGVTVARGFNKVRDNTRTYAVAITDCTHPVTGVNMFNMADDEIELDMELSIFYRDLFNYLKAQGVHVAGVKLGNYLTTQELSGISLSFCKADTEMKELWKVSGCAPFF